AAQAKQADADGVSTPACSLGFFHLSVKRGLDQRADSPSGVFFVRKKTLCRKTESPEKITNAG
ncbi:hypothetical protein, partial [Paenibacillus chitinolyticus]|uniref:hypothetical protein n=1 Tax=Paenibacillus chitinolyticus TaxID=79263 RepID=UPI00366B8234